MNSIRAFLYDCKGDVWSTEIRLNVTSKACTPTQPKAKHTVVLEQKETNKNGEIPFEGVSPFYCNDSFTYKI